MKKNIGIIYTKVIMLQRGQKTFNLSSDGKMEEVLQTSDILVIAKYLGEKKTKIAKISKNTKSIKIC